MAKRKRRKEITIHPAVDGVLRVELLSWKHFAKFINRDLLRRSHYAYRGHASGEWKLESSLDRLSRNSDLKPTAQRRAAHLRLFKKAARGRRGNTPKGIKEDEWWALGQHYGLATPLLDWTESPFVALYYAFLQAKTDSGTRVVFALSTSSVDDRSGEMKAANSSAKVVSMYSPDSDENSRLVSQSGLFSRLPDGVALEKWVTSAFKDRKSGVLLRIEIPDRDRDGCLASLHRMNINHATLFPELYGSAVLANTAYVIANYAGPV